ncbi:MAG: metal-dependent hydrolase [Tenuifilaceae bacterium]|jgi:inner membrane protein|nr:metal-dependent hydrolase [Tenuifilaceae bacterium]
MDSLTHIVLGAATGQVVLGKEVGNKALFWGAIAGSLPDFDAIFTPFIEPVSSLLFHRGPSHSLLFALIIAPIFGYLVHRIHKVSSITKWTGLFLLSIVMHSTIDIFNTYGTALLWPFSNVRLAFDSLGIIDLFLIIPILTLAILMVFKPQLSLARQKIASSILIFTLAFVLFSIGNKQLIEHRVKQQLKKASLDYNHIKTAPLPLTNFLWLFLVEDSSGYNYGYIGNFDEKDVLIRYIPRNHELLGNYAQNDEILKLIRFTKGFYTVKQFEDPSLWLYDLRFGSMAFESDDWYVFSFKLDGNPNSPSVSRAHPNRSFGIKTIKDYWHRLFNS